MDQSDIFVILDHVQFSKHSWHQRNKIKSCQDEEMLLTIPIIRKHPQAINETKIDNSQFWQKKHLKSIKQSYQKAKYYDKYIDFFEKLYASKYDKLVDITIPIILWMKDTLEIECEIRKSSELGVNGTKVDLVVDICHKVGADEYLSPDGSKEYIKANNIFDKENIKLEFHKYGPPNYTQLGSKFIPYLSAIDLLFNHGDESLSIIRSGRR